MGKFPRVGSDERKSVAQGLSGDQEIVSADRLARGFNFGPDHARGPGIILFEGKNPDGPRKKRFHSLCINFSTHAFCHPVPQLEDNDDGNHRLRA